MTDPADTRPAWTPAAACARPENDALDWFPSAGEVPAELRAVCRSCPVAAECLEHALTRPERHGVWAGTSAKERERMRRRRRRMVRS